MCIIRTIALLFGLFSPIGTENEGGDGDSTGGGEAHGDGTGWELVWLYKTLPKRAVYIHNHT